MISRSFIAVSAIVVLALATSVFAQIDTSKKALMVLSSVERYPNIPRATGWFLAEAAHFYHKIVEAGLTVDFVSPKGGYAPLDPISLQEATDDVCWQMYADPAFRRGVSHTLAPEAINPYDYSVIYYVGGHGTVYDFPDNKALQNIAAKIYENGGLVTGVCHGVVGLLNIRLSNGKLLIEGRKISGFTNEEEKLAKLDKVVPFLTEDELRKRGSNYVKGPAFTDFSVADGRVLTGQNPQSANSLTDKIIEALGRIEGFTV